MEFKLIILIIASIVCFNTHTFSLFDHVKTIIKPVSTYLLEEMSKHSKTSACMLTFSFLYGYQSFKKSALFQNPTVKKLRDSLAALRVKIYSYLGKQLTLLDSIKNNDETLTNYLLSNGANIHQKNSEGYTPLHFAVRNDNVAIVERLITAGADVNACTTYRYSVLDLAIIHGNIKIIKILLKHGASLSGHKPSIQYAIDKAKKIPSYKKIIEKLIDAKKIDLNKITSGDYPLSRALKNQDHELARLFLTKGANPNIGMSEPLTIAIKNSDEKALSILIDHKVDLNAQNSPSLNIAAQHGNTKIIDLLVKNKAFFDETETGQLQMSPLYVAAYYDQKEATEYLLGHGYTSTYKNIFNKTPYDVAREKNHDQIITIMDRFRSKTNPVTTERNAPSPSSFPCS